MLKILKHILSQTYYSIGSAYLSPILKNEWKQSMINNLNERSIEYQYALKNLSQLCPKKILDVGTGKTAWPHILANCGYGVYAIDKIDGYWDTYFNRHYYIINDDITDPKIKDQFDFITCISVIEHIPNHDMAIDGMFKLLKPGGYLLLTFPYNEKEYVDNIYKRPGAGYGQNEPYICHVFSRNDINGWLQRSNSIIINQEYYKVFTGNYWTFGQRIKPIEKVSVNDTHHLTCILLKKDL